ncbi:unnamed protein product [Aspergillus oryzae]|nr:unnamed protein product [Aspergillus oryzae]GMF91383.1 unnamed protein product [Aspergillus oryzae]
MVMEDSRHLTSCDLIDSISNGDQNPRSIKEHLPPSQQSSPHQLAQSGTQQPQPSPHESSSSISTQAPMYSSALDPEMDVAGDPRNSVSYPDGQSSQFNIDSP